MDTLDKSYRATAGEVELTTDATEPGVTPYSPNTFTNRKTLHKPKNNEDIERRHLTTSPETGIRARRDLLAQTVVVVFVYLVLVSTVGLLDF